MNRRSHGAALMEFALAWPVALLLVLGTVELALWASETFAARSAALAGARAASVAGSNPSAGELVAAQSLGATVFGARVVRSCPAGPAGPSVRVCARDLGAAVEVDVDGALPSLIPIVAGAALPIHAHVVIEKETFVP